MVSGGLPANSNLGRVVTGADREGTLGASGDPLVTPRGSPGDPRYFPGCPRGSQGSPWEIPAGSPVARRSEGPWQVGQNPYRLYIYAMALKINRID